MIDLSSVNRTYKFSKLIIALLFTFVSVSTFASDHKNHEADAAHSDHTEEKAFNASDMIAHHIADAHDFHIVGEISMPLPIILYTDNGLVTFLSSEFHHNDDGTVIVEKNGMKFGKVHEKIYQLSYGESVELNHETHEPKNAARIYLDFSITKNVFSMIMSCLLLLFIFGSVAKAYKKNQGAPKGVQNLFETLIVFVRDDIAIPNIGEKKYKKFLPYLLTLFFFLWINNLIGLVPFFPFSSNLTGNIAVTLTLAVMTMIVTNVNGSKDYWKHIFWMPGVPLPMKIIMAPIELVGVFSKPFALTIRLFANITAGHIIILALFSIIFTYQSAAWFGLSGPIALFMNVLELLVAFLQAYVFTLLTSLFIGQAVEEHDHH